MSWLCINSTAMAQVYVPPDLQRTSIVNETLDALENPQAETFKPSYKISGQVHTSVGIYSNGDAVFTRANADLNERNFRILSQNQLNRGINTFDPALYSRLKVVVDAAIAPSIAMHMNISVDPWSFTGKSKEMLVTSLWGDAAKVRYLTWGNTGYTVNMGANAFRYGDGFAIPEIKVNGNTVPAVNLPGVFENEYGQTDIFYIPETKID